MGAVPTGTVRRRERRRDVCGGGAIRSMPTDTVLLLLLLMEHVIVGAAAIHGRGGGHAARHRRRRCAETTGTGTSRCCGEIRTRRNLRRRLLVGTQRVREAARATSSRVVVNVHHWCWWA